MKVEHVAGFHRYGGVTGKGGKAVECVCVFQPWEAQRIDDLW